MALTTALLTYSHQFSLQQMDVNNNLVGNVVLLQTQSANIKKHRAKIDLTNAFSPAGRAEFGPGIQNGTFQLEGICDANLYWDLMWTTAMDNPYYLWGIFYFVKPTGVNFPIQLGAKLQVEDVELKWATSAEGKVGMWSATANVVGSIIKVGNDLAAATITGASS